MSHREPRDSDSKRHRSRLDRDRDPSPKRSRRDGKPAPERFPGSKDLNHKAALPLESPMPADSKPESKERKPNCGDHEVKNHSRPYSQHDDERGHDRSSGRGTAGERGWRDSRVQRDRNTGDDTRKREDGAKGVEKSKWGHDRFFENEAGDAQPVRKRPAFREEKIEEEDSAQARKATTETVALTQHRARYAVESGKDERGRRGRYLDRVEKPFGGDRRELPRAEFPSRERDRRDGGGNYGRVERFQGRPGFGSGGGRVEKWKHDLYHESDRSPTPKNEEDQIAKLEALLSS